MSREPSYVVVCRAAVAAWGLAFGAVGRAPTGFQTMGGVVSQPPNVTFLRWTVPSVGVATTGCVCFRETVQ